MMLSTRALHNEMHERIIMKHLDLHWLGFLILLLFIASMACNSAAPAAPAPTTTPAAPTIAPTATKPPTSTPRPAATPDVGATKAVEDFQARVDGYVEKGYLPTSNGTLYSLDDYKTEWAQMNYLSDLAPTGYSDAVQNFVYNGDFEWQSAVQNPETSGCGLYFRVQENGNFYSTYLDTERVVMGGYEGSTGPYVQRFGVTTGPGRVNIEYPAKANFTIIVNGHMAYVFVDDAFIGSYTLYTGKLLDPGYLGYFVKSGTNKDYGTRCTITNGKLWVPAE
jgi:hypothetical protein